MLTATRNNKPADPYMTAATFDPFEGMSAEMAESVKAYALLAEAEAVWHRKDPFVLNPYHLGMLERLEVAFVDCMAHFGHSLRWHVGGSVVARVVPPTRADKPPRIVVLPTASYIGETL